MSKALREQTRSYSLNLGYYAKLLEGSREKGRGHTSSVECTTTIDQQESENRQQVNELWRPCLDE